MKNNKYDWKLIGAGSIIVGLICYVFDIIHKVDLWQFLWICPVVAIFTGIALLKNNKFIISASIVWILLGPLIALIFSPSMNWELWHFHHIFSVFVLFFILFNLKKVWNPKGFAFGLTSFYSYAMITSYLSKGKINIICAFLGANLIILYLGIFFLILSLILIAWDKFLIFKK